MIARVAETPPALIVAGPTASGKSALALELAERFGGTIINADAMQVYRELWVLTARPTKADCARVPHALYGVRPASEPGNVAWWRSDAITEMERATESGRLPILTGGTGLYFSALVEGLSEIPEIGPEARAEARALLDTLGASELHRRLAAVDHETAARINPSDAQRLARAWEVWRETSIGLSEWQRSGRDPAPWRFIAVLLDPPVAELDATIAGRLRSMLSNGALDEVRALAALGLDPALPLMRAHGVGEFVACLKGSITLEQATLRTERVTRQYAKRQRTWFRHHRLAPPERVRKIIAIWRVKEESSKTIAAEIASFVQTELDAPQQGA